MTKTTDTSTRRKVGSRRGHKVNALCFSIMVKLLYDGTRTCAELAEETGLHVLTVFWLLSPLLHVQPRLVEEGSDSAIASVVLLALVYGPRNAL